MARFISLSERLILYFTLVGFSITAILLTYSYYSTQSAIFSRTYDQLISVKTEKKIRIESFFADRIKEIEVLSASKSSLHTNSLSDTLDFGNSFYNLLRNNKYYHRVYFVSHDSSIYEMDINNELHTGFIKRGNIQSYQNEIIQEFIKINDILTTDYYTNNNSSNPFFVICAESKFFNSKNGYLFFEISSETINSIMLEENPLYGLGNTGEIYLVGNDYYMRSQSRFIKNSINKIKVETEAVTNAFSNQPETNIINDYRNIKVISTFDHLNIKNLNWIVIAEMDYSEAMKPVYKIRNKIIFLSVIIFILILYIAYYLSKRITKPIINLTNAINKVGEGDFNLELKIKSNDEIGVLTESFNNMSIRLKQKTDELEKEKLMRLRAIIDGQELERQRLSRELHDGLGQSLIAIKLQIENIKLCDELNNQTKINKINDLVNSTIDDVKSMSDNLMPAVLKNFGVIKAIRNICSEYSDNSGINIQFNFNTIPQLADLIQNYLFRIVQECINNSVKHSGASELNVDLNYENEILTLTITDNGQGFDINSITEISGSGLPNIKERTILMNGTFNLFSDKSSGTKIIITIPIMSPLQ
ncbi:MAG: hypothetical protein A2046_01455 [Bacteroidetes bacterium GWA2_30_7]|nr:MAG: hypothetical protein A2046_01455 [Bacteroidetes bacterium GWA2_30_7]